MKVDRLRIHTFIRSNKVWIASNKVARKLASLSLRMEIRLNGFSKRIETLFIFWDRGSLGLIWDGVVLIDGASVKDGLRRDI